MARQLSFFLPHPPFSTRQHWQAAAGSFLSSSPPSHLPDLLQQPPLLLHLRPLLPQLLHLVGSLHRPTRARQLPAGSQGVAGAGAACILARCGALGPARPVWRLWGVLGRIVIPHHCPSPTACPPAAARRVGQVSRRQRKRAASSLQRCHNALAGLLFRPEGAACGRCRLAKPQGSACECRLLRSTQLSPQRSDGPPGGGCHTPLGLVHRLGWDLLLAAGRQAAGAASQERAGGAAAAVGAGGALGAFCEWWLHAGLRGEGDALEHPGAAVLHRAEEPRGWGGTFVSQSQLSMGGGRPGVATGGG